jgi:hypothetical protein
MASLVKTAPPHHQLSFTRQSGSSPLNVLPQAPVAPPAASQLKLSTNPQDSTPDRPRSMSFSMGGGFGTPTGTLPAQRHYGESNMQSMHSGYPGRQASSIYTVSQGGPFYWGVLRSMSSFGPRCDV